ncbi:MAG: hypothetical protein J7L61_04285 [Thermoplasmata archaeon]|nr:hypothetical protein [Thermoplasmata archaeon]
MRYENHGTADGVPNHHALSLLLGLWLVLGGVLVFSPGMAHAAPLYVQGDVTTDTTWTNETVYVNETISIAQGASLTISPGVRVLVNDSRAIFVNGSLVVGNGVVFCNMNPGSSWAGVRFNQNTTGDLDGVRFENASTALAVKSPYVSLSNVTAYNCSLALRILSPLQRMENVTLENCTTGAEISGVSAGAGGGWGMFWEDGRVLNSTWGVNVTNSEVLLRRLVMSGNDRAALRVEGSTVKVENTTVTGEGNATVAVASTVELWDSSLVSSGIEVNLKLSSDSTVRLYNTTDNMSAPGITDVLSRLYRYWPLMVRVYDALTGFPVENASVDVANATSQSYHNTTDPDGEAWFMVLDEVRGLAGVVSDANPYNITASAPWYHSNTSTGLVVDSPTNIVLNLTPWDVDLYPSNWALSLSGPGDVHRLGDMLWLDVEIANRGADPVHDVPVYYLDTEGSTGDNDTTNWTVVEADLLPVVEGNSSVQSTAILSSLPPGWHNITVWIDPNATTVDGNTTNNTLWLQRFRMNAPPGVNITSPANGSTVEGTAVFTGTAWDNSTDMDDNVTWVRYRLTGKDGGTEGIPGSLANWTYASVDRANATNSTIDGGGVRLVNWTFSLDTTTLDDGAYLVVVEAGDGNHTAAANLSLLVDNNRPPQLSNLTAGMKGTGGVESEAWVRVDYTDPEGMFPVNITVNITDGPGGYTAVFPMSTWPPQANGTYSASFSLPEKGDYTLHSSAYDGETWVSTSSMVLTVNNTPPEIIIGGVSPGKLPSAGGLANFTVMYTDADGDTPAYGNLTLDGNTYPLSINSSGTPETGIILFAEVNVTGQGEHHYNFTVSDGNDTATSATYTLVVNTPPVLQNLTIEPPTKYSGTEITFSVVYLDINGDPPLEINISIRDTGGYQVFYSEMDQADLNAPENGTTYVKSFSLYRGLYSYEIMAHDGWDWAQTLNGSFSVENDPPTASITGVAPLGEGLYLITWDDSDADDNATLYVYYTRDANMSSENLTLITMADEDDPADEATWNTTGIEGGFYYLVIEIRDPFTYSREMYPSQVYVNRPPEISYISPNGTLEARNTARITWMASDPDGDQLTVDIYYDEDTTPGGWSAVASGISNTGFIEWNTSAVPQGWYYMALKAYDGHNGTRLVYSTGRVHVSRPDVMFSTSIDPQSPEPGENFTLRTTVTYSNQTTYRGPLTVEFQGTLVEGNTTYSGEYETSFTAPGSEGVYNLTIRVEIQGDVYTEVVQVAVALPPMANLLFAAAPVVDPEEPVPGDEVTITARVMNDGEVTGSPIIALYVGNTTGSPVAQASKAISPGMEEIVSLAWTPLSPGQYTLILSIDPMNLVEEENEDDNNATISLEVISLPDLEVRDQDVVPSNTNPKEGESVSIAVRVHNTGDEEASSVVSLHLDTPTGKLLDEKTVTVSPGGYLDVVLTWENVTQGSHTLYVVVDGSGQVRESDEGNNQASVDLTVEAYIPGPAGTGSGSTTFLIFSVLVLLAAAVTLVVIKQRRGL